MMFSGSLYLKECCIDKMRFDSYGVKTGSIKAKTGSMLPKQDFIAKTWKSVSMVPKREDVAKPLSMRLTPEVWCQDRKF